MQFCKVWKDISESLRKGDIRRENQLAAADAIDYLIQLHKEDTDEVVRLTKLCKEIGGRMSLKYSVGDEISFNIKGRVKRIDIENGICYTVVVNDGNGREAYLYLDDDLLPRKD